MGPSDPPVIDIVAGVDSDGRLVLWEFDNYNSVQRACRHPTPCPTSAWPRTDRIHRCDRARTVVWPRPRTTTRARCTWTRLRERPESIPSSSAAGTSRSHECARCSTQLPNASNGRAGGPTAARSALPAARKRAATSRRRPTCLARQQGSRLTGWSSFECAPSSIRMAAQPWKVRSFRASRALFSRRVRRGQLVNGSMRDYRAQIQDMPPIDIICSTAPTVGRKHPLSASPRGGTLAGLQRLRPRCQ